MALQACTGHFLGGDDRYIALLYSDRVVFRLLDEETNLPAENSEEIVISIPQPQMMLGGTDNEELPNLGNVFFSVGRNRDMLALQFRSALVFLSVNSVDRLLELQGCWGLPKTDKMQKTPSSASLAAYVEHPHMPKMRRPQLGHRPSSSSGIQTLTSIADDVQKLSLPQSLSPGGSGDSPRSNKASGLGLSSEFAPPEVSPDGTQVFVVTRTKYGTIRLLVLSAFGQELIKMEVEYINVLTQGWITDDVVFIVYLNQNFHKKFQTFRLRNKLKQTGLFGMGRKAVKPSFSAEINVPLAVDFLPSIKGLCGGPNLVFKEYVLLGTKSGGYVRVNHRSSSWEPVLNAKNVIGAVIIDGVAVVVQSDSVRPKPELLTFATISESTVHALKVDAMVRKCLCSTHSISGDTRIILGLLHLGNGVVLDYKRLPFHAYKFSRGRVAVPLTILPWKGQDFVLNPGDITESAKLTHDFLVKTELSLFTRDANGDDTQFAKIMGRETVYTVPAGRAGLLKLVYRDVKSVYAVFTNPVEVRVLDESHSKPAKMRTKASYVFPDPYCDWEVSKIIRVSRNILLLVMTQGSQWGIFVVSFVNSTHKTNPTPPQVSLVLPSQENESPPSPLQSPGNAFKYVIQVYNPSISAFSRQFNLYLSSSGQFRLERTEVRVVPSLMDENEHLSFFTEFDGPLDGMYLAGITNSDRPSPSPSPQPSPGLHTPLMVADAKISHVLAVESPSAVDGTAIVLPNKEYHKSCVWIFDSDGAAFREFTVQDIPDIRKSRLRHYEQILRAHQSVPNAHSYQLSPDFQKKQFLENSRNNFFRPLPEMDAVVTRGIGAGLDAEVYLKTPDNGVYAIFRIQNKKLLESLQALEQAVLERVVAVWLPEELKKPWLADFQGSNMVSGSAFAAFWRLDDSWKARLCKDAGVDFEFVRKIRPP